MELLEARPRRCYRCLEPRHIAAKCEGPDRSRLCYRCGGDSHRAMDCKARIMRCPLCEAYGEDCNHRLGSKSCSRSARRRGGGRGDHVGGPFLRTAAESGNSGQSCGATREEETVPRLAAHRKRGSPADETRESPPLGKSSPRGVGWPSPRDTSAGSAALTKSQSRVPAAGPTGVAAPSAACSVASGGLVVGGVTGGREVKETPAPLTGFCLIL